MNTTRNAIPTATMAAAKTTPSSKLLKRAEAARLLGVSVSTLRRREGEMLNPIVGPDGVHLFEESEVRAVMVTLRGRATLAALGPSAGDTAADVFTLLDDGVHPVEIVKQLRLAPDVVSALHDQWARMRGGFTVNSAVAEEFGRLARSRAPSTAAAAIAALRTRVERLTRMKEGSVQCQACGDRTASICEPCIAATRGAMGSMSVEIERRTTSGDRVEARLVAELYWDPAGECAGDVFTVRSEWFSADADYGPISRAVNEIGQSAACSRQDVSAAVGPRPGRSGA